MLADEGFGEWGFAALVEVDGRKILFDTGAHEDTVQRNLRELKLDLSDVELVILSHNHADHTTGLMTLRRQFAAANPKALSTAYAGTGLFYPRLDATKAVDDRMSAIRRQYEATGATVIDVTGPMEILPGVWLTGPVPRVHPERNWSGTGKRAHAEGRRRRHGARGHDPGRPDRAGPDLPVRLRARRGDQHPRARPQDHRRRVR